MSAWLTKKDIQKLRASEEVNAGPIGRMIDDFFRRSIASQKGHRRKRRERMAERGTLEVMEPAE